MGNLNKNSFIRWQGSFAGAPATRTAVDDTVELSVAGTYIDIPILTNDSATYGINANSVQILTQDNIVTPATWDPIGMMLRYYPPAGVIVGQIRELTYKWNDNAGNASNTAGVFIEIIERPTAWRGLASSYACELSGMDNTGNGLFATLEQYYTDDNSSVVPANEKPNDIGDPDYIAPAPDPVSCPVVTSPEDLEVFNFMNSTTDPKPEIYEIKTTQGATVVIYDLSHFATSPQPLALTVEAGLYDSIEVKIANAIVGVCQLYLGGVFDESFATTASALQTITFASKSLVAGSQIFLDI